MNAVEYTWRGDFTSSEANQLHADAFNHRVYEESEWDWVRLCHEHSLGWVTARIAGRLVGFVNVLWDGLVHAWIQDEMVSLDTRHQGIGLRLIDVTREAAKQAGCEWLHVDFDDDVRPFYIDAAGFTPTNGGLTNSPIQTESWRQRLHNNSDQSLSSESHISDTAPDRHFGAPLRLAAAVGGLACDPAGER